MKRSLIVLCIVLGVSAVCATAWARMNAVVVGGGESAVDTCSGYLVCQNFETATTGYDNSESWTETGTVEAAYATGPARGSQSCQVTNGSRGNARSKITISSASELWGHYRYKVSDATPTTALYGFEIFNGTTAIGSVRLLTSGLIRGSQGTPTGTASAGNELSDNTWIHIWWYWKAESVDTAADGIMTIWQGTTLNRDEATQVVNITTGTAEATADGVAVESEAASGSDTAIGYFDQVMVKTSEFTTVPE